MNAVDLIVEDENWKALPGLARRADEAVAAAISELESGAPGVAAILLTDDAAVAMLNSAYRNREGPTNVLSFPSVDHADNHLGDIAIAHGVTAREANERGIEIIDHLMHLIIHAFLHLQGYDHQTDEDAEIMEALERRALARLGIADPYRVRDDAVTETDTA